MAFTAALLALHAGFPGGLVMLRMERVMTMADVDAGDAVLTNGNTVLIP